MKKIIVAAVCSLGVLCANAQINNEENTNVGTVFFAEVGGPGVLFSANLDKRFKKERLGWGFRGGLGFVSAYDYDGNNNSNFNNRSRSVLTVPVQVNYLFGKSTSASIFEVGAGATYLSKKLGFLDFYGEDRTQLLGTATFMYRRQPVNGGFTWRVGFTPLISNGYIQPLGAASIGYSF